MRALTNTFVAAAACKGAHQSWKINHHRLNAQQSSADFLALTSHLAAHGVFNFGKGFVAYKISSAISFSVLVLCTNAFMMAWDPLKVNEEKFNKAGLQSAVIATVGLPMAAIGFWYAGNKMGRGGMDIAQCFVAHLKRKL